MRNSIHALQTLAFHTHHHANLSLPLPGGKHSRVRRFETHILYPEGDSYLRIIVHYVAAHLYPSTVILLPVFLFLMLLMLNTPARRVLDKHFLSWGCQVNHAALLIPYQVYIYSRHALHTQTPSYPSHASSPYSLSHSHARV